jgi:hypothetical protein
MNSSGTSLSEQFGPGADDEDVYVVIHAAATDLGMSDIDVWCAWKLGLAAYQQMRELRGKLPHDQNT